MTYYVSIGSAHLDIIAQSTGDTLGIDQPGTTKIEMGGTACNIAINWAKLQIPSRLLTVTDGSILSRMILSHVEHQNVSVIADRSDTASVGVFSAHLNASGELSNAISFTPIETHTFSEEAFELALTDAKYVVMDCNLSAQELAATSIECLARAIPFAIAGVSQEKCIKINTLRSMPSLVCLNRHEADYFLDRILHVSAQPPQEAIVSLSKHLRAPCVITLGSEGAIFYDGKAPPIWEKSNKIAEKGNRLGAGDGFLAAFVHAMEMLSDKSPRHALHRALRIAGVMATRPNANLGSLHPMSKALDELEAQK